MPSNNDGRVIINIDSNAQKAAQDFNALDRAVKKTDTDTKAFSGSANVLKNALGAIGVGYVTSQLVNLGKSAVNTSMDFQALENRMNAAAGNKSIGADSLAYIREQADRLGLEFRTTADSFAGFEAAALRSGLTLEQTKQIFTDVSTAATSMQLSTDRVQLVFKALEQISGKGTVSMEELRQQLGDSLPGAFEIAAQSMGMTTKAFYDAVANGEVLSSEFLPKFAKAVREQLGGSAEEASTQLRASLNRLNTDLMDSSNAWGTLLQPSVQKGVEAFRDAAQASTQLANTLKFSPEITSTATSIAAATTATLGLSTALRTIIPILATIPPTLAAIRNGTIAINLAGLLNPIGLLSAAIGGVTYALVRNKLAIDDAKRSTDLFKESLNLETSEAVRQLREYGELINIKNKTNSQVERLKELTEELTSKYPKYIDKLRQELTLKGKISQATAEQIANEITLAKVKQLQDKKNDIDKQVAAQQRAYRMNNTIAAARFGTSIDTTPGRQGVRKYLQIQQDELNKQLKTAKDNRQKIIKELTFSYDDFSLAPSIGNIGSSGSSSSAEKQKDAFDRLQEAAKNARREVELNAIAYGTSSQQVQQAFEKYRNLNTQLNDINKIFDKNTKKVKENGGAYADLQEKISETRNQLLNMAVSGQGDTAQFTMLKNTLKQYETQAQQANTAVTNSVGLSWKNISNTISSQLSYALTTPLQEGENAFERLGNVALNVIGQIAQAWLSNSLNNLFSGSGGKSSAGGLLSTLGGVAGSIFGPIGSTIGGFLGNTLGGFFKDGAPFQNGRVVPFAQGGVVQSASTFPMSGNRTGLMGERGAEAIMPLKRTPSGQLGVQAQVQQPSINIYNQSGANIETVQRPDGDTDIFIKRVNSALRSERTQSGFSSALQRNNSRGVQAS